MQEVAAGVAMQALDDGGLPGTRLADQPQAFAFGEQGIMRAHPFAPHLLEGERDKDLVGRHGEAVDRRNRQGGGPRVAQFLAGVRTGDGAGGHLREEPAGDVIDRQIGQNLEPVARKCENQKISGLGPADSLAAPGN